MIVVRFVGWRNRIPAGKPNSQHSRADSEVWTAPNRFGASLGHVGSLRSHGNRRFRDSRARD